MKVCSWLLYSRFRYESYKPNSMCEVGLGGSQQKKYYRVVEVALETGKLD